ncbi:MAG: DUF4105 domain-containing protein, partial [Muribaculaceae bacterium]|nr:DUF4105 domain-containing protein [Muribaculaceae bacterium]
MKPCFTLIFLPLLLLAATGQVFLCAASPADTGLAPVAAANDSVAIAAPGSEPEPDRLAPDFVRVSVLVADPGQEIYQIVGHAAIRMECPFYGLDNVFSFETDNRGGWVGQFVGEANGRFIRMSTAEWLEQYRAAGRGVAGYELNLTPEQKLVLWRNLDISAETLAEERFNVRRRHCLAACIGELELALRPDTIAVTSAVTRPDNGHEINRTMSPFSKWVALIYMNVTAADCDKTDHWTTRAMPVSFADYFATAEIVDADGRRRSMLTGRTDRLVEARPRVATGGPTPMVWAWGLTALAAMLSAAAFSGRGRRIAAPVCVALMVMQTLLALLLAFLAFMPNRIGAHWNWLFVPVNPLPLILWLSWRRHRRGRLGLALMVLGAVDLIFAAVAMPVTSQITPETALLSVALGLP